MDSNEFRKEFLEDVKATASITGEGSCATFVDNMSQYLIDSDVLSDFIPSFYTGYNGRSKYRVDGYVFDEFDNTMNLIIANYDGNDSERKITNAIAMHDFGQLRTFLDAIFKTDLSKKIEMSTPCADLVDFLLRNSKDIRKYRFLAFTDAELSSNVKSIEIESYDNIPIEGQIWDIERLFRVCCSDLGRQTIEVDFRNYCGEGIPCLEASSLATNQYRSYLTEVFHLLEM